VDRMNPIAAEDSAELTPAEPGGESGEEHHGAGRCVVFCRNIAAKF